MDNFKRPFFRSRVFGIANSIVTIACSRSELSTLIPKFASQQTIIVFIANYQGALDWRSLVVPKSIRLISTYPTGRMEKVASVQPRWGVCRIRTVQMLLRT